MMLSRQQTSTNSNGSSAARIALRRIKPQRSIPRPVIGWDVDRIIDEAGGVQELVKLLQDRVGNAPGQNTVSMWKIRGSIPSQWLGAIMYILLSEKRQSVFRYLRAV